MAQIDEEFIDELEEVDGSNLIVNYLPDEMSEMIMFDMFAKYGEVDSVRIIRDRMTQAPRGYGFVKYKHPDSARAAIENLDGLHIMHKKLKVAVSRPGGVRLKANLFIGSLPPSFGEEDLTRLFCDFHPIIDVRILRFSDGTSKQCGFVRLDNDELASKAIEALNGISTDGYRIQVKHAHGKRKRRPPKGRGGSISGRGLQSSNSGFANYAPTAQSFNPNASQLYDSPSFHPMGQNQGQNIAWPPPRVAIGNVVNPNHLYTPQLYTPEYSSTPPPASASLMLNHSPMILAVAPHASPLLNNQNTIMTNSGVTCYTPPLQPVLVATPPLTPNLVPANFSLAATMPVLDLNAGGDVIRQSPPNLNTSMPQQMGQMNLNPLVEGARQHPIETNTESTIEAEPKKDNEPE